MKKILKIIFFLLLTLQTTFAVNFSNSEIKNFDWLLGVEHINVENINSQVVDLDVLDTPKNVVEKLHKKGIIVIGYINVGSIETYRDDYKNFPKSVIGKIYPGWEDENFLDVKNFSKFKSLIIHRLDIAEEKGFDGIEPDNMDTYENFSETGFKISKQDMINYILWLKKETKKRNMFLIQKNAPELSSSLEKSLDGALIEDGFYEKFVGDFLNYIKNKKIVFDVEYTDNINKKYFLEEVCLKAKKLGIITILKNRNLDSFVVNCPTSPQPSPLRGEGVEQKINKKLDSIISKLEKKYSKEKIKIFYKKIINLVSKLEKNKKYQNKIFLLKIIKNRFEIELYKLDSKKLIPKKDKIYFGAFQYFGNNEIKVTKERLNKFKKLLGRKPAWAYFSQDFAEEGIKFPKESVQKIIDAGEIPFIRLMPSMVYEKNKKTYNLSDISSGKFDDKFRVWAREARKINSPILIDFAVEPNGEWFFYSHKPEDFKNAYRHIIDIFREEKVHNLTYFFHFNLQSFPNEAWNKPARYYPGDEYIDWIGFSLYGTQNPVDKNEDFTQNLKGNYKDILAVSKNKPLALLEFGVADFNPNYSKKTWLENTFKTILKNPYVHFDAINIWSEKWEEEDFYSDLRINSSKESLEIYRKNLGKSVFENDLEFR